MSRSSTLVLVLFCLYNLSFLESLNNGGFSVEIIHRDSSRSPLFRPTETQFQRVANAVRRSVNRANHFHTNKAKAIITQDDGEYLMSYSVGTPPFQIYGIVDTGSDMIWLQCQPCKTCYNQTTSIFDPSKSNTYKTLPFSSTTCQSVEDTTCSSDHHNGKKMCEYTIYYGDESYSNGDLSLETLTLGSTNGSYVQFPRTVIGCGHNNSVLFGGKGSGVVGLGNGPVSLVNQLGRSSIGGKFSYCFASMSNISSKLNFGDAAVVSGDGTVSTPIATHNPKVFYYLTLEALSVGNNRIEFTTRSSSSRFGGNKGINIIIDSGTTLTLLPNDVYSKLESAVAHAVNKLKRVKDPTKQLSLCYKIITFDDDELDVHVPVITAHFSGADVKLNAVNTFVEVEEGVVCLAFMSSKIGTIFGNLAQQNFLVGYDLPKKIVSFKPADCSKQ